MDIVTVEMGSLNNGIFIAGQQHMYYFIRKSCGPLGQVTMDPQLRSPDLNNHKTDKTVNIKTNDSKLPTDKPPKYLGVYLDRTLTYRKHQEESANQLKKRNSLIRKLTGTTWSALPSVVKIFALALCFGVAEYCALVRGRSSCCRNNAHFLTHR